MKKIEKLRMVYYGYDSASMSLLMETINELIDGMRKLEDRMKWLERFQVTKEQYCNNNCVVRNPRGLDG